MLSREQCTELLIDLTRSDYTFILEELKSIAQQADTEDGIDVRLCLDIGDEGDASWIVRSGDASYDQRHSQYCGASTVYKGCNVQAVLEDLIDQCLDQASM